MRATIRVFACLLILIAGAAVEGRAQGFQGGIRGAVKDSGGVIPGAEVTLTNQGTSLSRTTTTNAAGEYSFPNLAPGTYRLRIALQGYKAYAQEGIPVGTQQFITLDITLDVGTVAETVTVTGQSPIIETSNASTGTVLNAEALQTLPSQGRAAFMIGNTVPTVVPSGDGQYNRQQDQTNVALVSLGGGTRRGNNYTLDGVPISDMRNRASAHPSIESLEDMKVQVHTYDAEMGRTGGGVFNTTLKSGTNSFRGTAFFQTRPIWGQWNNYFGEKAGRPKPDSPYYLGGGAFGGPIVRNRTFFWFTTESYHDVQTRNVSTLFPTAAMRRGDFSGVTNSAGQPVTIYNPVTGQPFAGNQIPSHDDEPGRGGDARVHADARHRSGQRQHELHAHVAHQEQFLPAVLGQARAQVHRQRLAQRVLPVQQHERARGQLLRQRRPERADPLRRSERLLPAAAAADPGAEQHLGAEQHVGAGAAVREDGIPGQRHGHDRLRSAQPALLDDLQEPDSAGQVSPGPDPRLRSGPRRAHARRDQPDRDQLEVDQRERDAVESLPARTRSSSAATGGRWASTPSSPATAPASSISTRT